MSHSILETIITVFKFSIVIVVLLLALDKIKICKRLDYEFFLFSLTRKICGDSCDSNTENRLKPWDDKLQ